MAIRTAITAGAAAIVALLTIPAAPAVAADPASCKPVRFAETGWTDIAVTTALASRVLSALGYAPAAATLSVPATYAALKGRQADVFLGNWMPTMAADRQPYLDDGTIEVIGPNLAGAKYTLAVPAYTYAAGLRDFRDIAKFRDRLGGRIHGIEPGNDGNRLILGMIGENRFGLKGFSLVEASETGMLADVERAIGDRQDIVFLGWEPHPMNTRLDMQYLSGGDEVFGPDYGRAAVYTNVRAGYTSECPNLGTFLKNLAFDLKMEDEMMGSVIFDGAAPAIAADHWLRKHPAILGRWLAGVTTFDGKPAIDAVGRTLAGG